jgi:hypothetical protein
VGLKFIQVSETTVPPPTTPQALIENNSAGFYPMKDENFVHVDHTQQISYHEPKNARRRSLETIFF